MSLKDVFNKLFSYKPQIEYNFSISDTTTKNEYKENNNINNNGNKKPEKIFPSIKVNKEYMQTNITH